jgi:hypothetical protein
VKYFYPHAVARLRVIWQNFGDESNLLLNKPYEVLAIPRMTKVEVNSYTEADTFDIELDYKTFPFDPRSIRSCQVTIFMDNLDSLGDPLTVMAPSTDNAVFEGFADEDNMTFDDTARTVRLKGRDFTALLIDARWPGKLLPMTAPVDIVLAGVLARLPAMGDVTVSNRTDTPVLPTLAQFYPDYALLAGQRGAKRNEKYWDVIQDVCTRAGLICYMELNELVLDRPRTLYDPSKAVQLVYGKNVKTLEMTRKLGRQKGFNLVVRSIKGKEVIKAEIPKDSTRLPEGGDYVYVPIQTPLGVMVNKNDPSSRAPLMSFVVANVNDKTHLIEMGEKIYEEIGRQQIEGKLKTTDMEAPANEVDIDNVSPDGECFNLLKLRVASPLSIVIGSEDLESISKEANVARRIKYLTDRGYTNQVASVFAQTLGKYTTPFYTKSIVFTVDAEQGFSIDIDFINFIETAGKGLGVI